MARLLPNHPGHLAGHLAVPKLATTDVHSLLTVRA